MFGGESVACVVAPVTAHLCSFHPSSDPSVSEALVQMASPRADITPEVLKWARERAHYTTAEAATKAGTSEERYIDFEEGDKSPTLKQLYDLAKAFRQSVGTFYLEAPPEKEEPLKEMRRLSDAPPVRESSSLATAVEDVLQRRRNALDMYSDLGEEPPQWQIRASLDADPESVGTEVRDYVNAEISEQQRISRPYQALDYWRNLLAQRGVLTFQIPRVSVEEMRGFAISKFPLPVVGVNRKDSPTARIFTLLHEVGHILLEDSILHHNPPSSNPKDDDLSRGESSDDEIERFCNEVAAATIIPKGHLLDIRKVTSKGKKAIWGKSDIREISSMYSISPAVAVRRLFNFDCIADSVFYNLVEEFDRYNPAEEGSESDGGNYYKNQRSELGNFYSDLAFRAYNNGSVNLSDLSSILDVKIDNLPRYRKEVYS